MITGTAYNIKNYPDHCKACALCVEIVPRSRSDKGNSCHTYKYRCKIFGWITTPQEECEIHPNKEVLE